MARLALHGSQELVWDGTRCGEKAFPEFWYQASGRRAFVREGPRRYSRHTLDLKRLDAEARAAKWRCEHDRSSCDANQHLVYLADDLREYTSFRRELFDIAGHIERDPAMSRWEKEQEIAELMESVGKHARDLKGTLAADLRGRDE